MSLLQDALKFKRTKQGLAFSSDEMELFNLQDRKTEYCQNCKKIIIPEKVLITNGDMTLCPNCGLALSATDDKKNTMNDATTQFWKDETINQATKLAEREALHKRFFGDGFIAGRKQTLDIVLTVIDDYNLGGQFDCIIDEIKYRV